MSDSCWLLCVAQMGFGRAGIPPPHAQRISSVLQAGWDLTGTPETSWEHTPVLESLAKLLGNMGKQDQLPLGRDVVQGNTPGLRDEQGWEWSPRVPAQGGGY